MIKNIMKYNSNINEHNSDAIIIHTNSTSINCNNKSADHMTVL